MAFLVGIKFDVVRVGSIQDSQSIATHLGRGLEQCLQYIGGGTGNGRYYRSTHGLGLQTRTDVNDMQGRIDLTLVIDSLRFLL